ncbi:MAG: GNAT family N-acetyltransferase [Actinomycetota bacterium]|nr:GNAT family N-acetyltransferase [Actinomycetota bacterium]
MREDVPRLAELTRAAIAELTPTRGGQVWRAAEARTEPIEKGLETLLDHPDALVVAGTLDGVIVGYAVVRVEHLPDGSRLGVIDDIFVEDEARGIGLGETMMSDLIAWSVDRRCFGMDAMALPGHRQTKNFFEESGFTARKLVMHHSLARDPTDAMQELP